MQNFILSPPRKSRVTLSKRHGVSIGHCALCCVSGLRGDGKKEGRWAGRPVGAISTWPTGSPRKEFIKLICRGDASRKFRRWPHFIIVGNYSAALVHVLACEKPFHSPFGGEARAFYRLHFPRAKEYRARRGIYIYIYIRKFLVASGIVKTRKEKEWGGEAIARLARSETSF